MQPIFNTNQITLYQGDCLEIMPSLPDHSIDFILCDLPYQQVNCEWDVLIPFEPLWEQYRRLIKPNGAIALFGSQPFTTDLIMSNRKWFKYEWIWDKKKCAGFLNANKQPLRAHENILIFSQGQSFYNPQMTLRTDDELKKLAKNACITKNSKLYGNGFQSRSGTKELNAEKFPNSIIRINGLQQNASEKTEHPTQKPVALLEYLIRTYTTEGETVLDNTCGSGSTLVAARDTGRKAIGIEKDPKYCQIAIERCSQLSIFEQAV